MVPVCSLGAYLSHCTAGETKRALASPASYTAYALSAASTKNRRNEGVFEVWRVEFRSARRAGDGEGINGIERSMRRDGGEMRSVFFLTKGGSVMREAVECWVAAVSGREIESWCGARWNARQVCRLSSVCRL